MYHKDLVFSLAEKSKTLGLLKLQGCHVVTNELEVQAEFECGRTSGASGQIELSLDDLKKALREMLQKLPQ